MSQDPPHPHPAILTIDIIHEVLSHLQLPATAGWNVAGPCENKVALARAARVCTAFHEPATQALWWAIPGIDPVLRVLDNLSLVTIWRGGPRTNLDAHLSELAPDAPPSSGYQVNMAGEISQDNWERFLDNTARTRLIYECWPKFTVSPAVFVYLSYRSHGRPIFPKLRELAWGSPSADHLRLLPFLSPSLRRLKITTSPNLTPDSILPAMFGADLVDLDGLLQTVLPRLENLAEFEVEGAGSARMQDAASWTCIAQLRTLGILRLDGACPVSSLYPSGVSFLSITDLPALEELKLSVSMAAYDADYDPRRFTTLTTLVIEAYGPLDAKFLDVFASPHLHTLSLTYWRLTPPFAVASAISRAALAFPKLRALDVQLRAPGSSPAAPNSRGASFERMFGALRRADALESLALHAPPGVVLAAAGDAELAHLAQSWPNLRVLSLLATLDGRVTQAAVAAFARACPRLRELHLRGVHVGHVAAADMPARGSAPLEKLGLCRARVDSPKACIEFVRRLFPGLRPPGEGEGADWGCAVCAEQRWDQGGVCARGVSALNRAGGKAREAPRGRKRKGLVEDVPGREAVRAKSAGRHQ